MNLKLDIDTHAVCRICLSQTNNLINYFSNIVIEGYIISVPDMVMKCLDIESSEDDGLPDKLCDLCKKEITNFHLFKEKSARTEKILLTAFNKPLRNKDKKSVVCESKPPTSTVAIQTTTEHSFTCLECKMIFKTENLLSKHVNNKHSTMKTDADSQTDAITTETEQIFVDEVPESIDYKREMKMEVLEVDDIEIEEMHIDMEDVVSEPKDDGQTVDEIEEKAQHEYQCNDCFKTFDQIESISSHKCTNVVTIVNETSNTHDTDELSEQYYEELIHEIDMYECDRCKANFTSAEEYTSHRTSNDCEQIEILLRYDGGKAKVDDDHHCNLCHKRFKTMSTFNQHQKLHESIDSIINYLSFSTCDDCHKVFLLETNRLNHDCPKKRKTSDGEIIDESCTDYQYLEQDSDFVCDICSLEFPNLGTARQHVVTHAKTFVCPFEGCGCSYEIWSRFAMHLGTKHLNAKRHQCRFCEVECDSFDSLQAHYKDDCPEKKFKCGHCEKSYFSQKALNLHIKDITKGKTFACTYCNKSFNRRGELDLHNRSHTNERPYKCTICGKAYKTSSMRAAHMDAHIEGKTFPCTLCDKKLQTRTSYRNHMKRHTEEKKHQCEHCGKKFFTKFHVKLHASKIHARTKPKPLKGASNIIHIEYEDVVDSMDDEQITPSY